MDGRRYRSARRRSALTGCGTDGKITHRAAGARPGTSGPYQKSQVPIVQYPCAPIGRLGAIGLLPDTTRAAALSPDGTVAYVLDEPSGAASGVLETYHLSSRSSNNPNSYFTQTGSGIPMSLDGGTGAIAMTMTPDGGTLVIAGVSGIYVQPTPQ
jgi:hypothetical protein